VRMRVALSAGDLRSSATLLGVGVVTHEPDERELTPAQVASLRGKGFAVAEVSDAAAERPTERVPRGRHRMGGATPAAAETTMEEGPAAPAPSEGEE